MKFRSLLTISLQNGKSESSTPIVSYSQAHGLIQWIILLYKENALYIHVMLSQISPAGSPKNAIWFLETLNINHESSSSGLETSLLETQLLFMSPDSRSLMGLLIRISQSDSKFLKKRKVTSTNSLLSTIIFYNSLSPCPTQLLQAYSPSLLSMRP